jgi:hypothetical protein
MSVTVVDDDIVRARSHRTYRSDLAEWGYCVDCHELEHESDCVSDEEAEDEY